MSCGCVTVQLSTVNSRGGAPNTPRHGIRNELRMQYLGYTLEDYQGEEYPVPHTYPPLPPPVGPHAKGGSWCARCAHCCCVSEHQRARTRYVSRTRGVQR